MHFWKQYYHFLWPFNWCHIKSYLSSYKLFQDLFFYISFLFWHHHDTDTSCADVNSAVNIGRWSRCGQTVGWFLSHEKGFEKPAPLFCWAAFCWDSIKNMPFLSYLHNMQTHIRYFVKQVTTCDNHHCLLVEILCFCRTMSQVRRYRNIWRVSSVLHFHTEIDVSGGILRAGRRAVMHLLINLTASSC